MKSLIAVCQVPALVSISQLKKKKVTQQEETKAATMTDKQRSHVGQCLSKRLQCAINMLVLCVASRLDARFIKLISLFER